MSRKDEIIHDLNYLCSSDCQISEKTTRKILESISWEWTENRDGDGCFTKNSDGYLGCTYWSQKALEAVYEDLSCFKKKKGIKIRSVVTHEHVIPKTLFVKYVMEQIKQKHSITFDKQSIDNTMLIGCIITKDEDAILNKVYKAEMPNGVFPVDPKNIWDRYKRANEWCKNNNRDEIIVYHITWVMNGKKIVVSDIKPIEI